MTSASIGERLDSNLNRTSLVQTSTGREVSAIRSGLFEQILAAPPPTPAPEPTDATDVEAESSSVEPSSDTSSSDEQAAEPQTAETDTESEEVSGDASVAVQVTNTQRVEPDTTETNSAEQLTNVEVKSTESLESEAVSPSPEDDSVTTFDTAPAETEAEVEISVEAAEFESVSLDRQEGTAQTAAQADPQTEAPKRSSNYSRQEPEPEVERLPQEQNRPELVGEEKPAEAEGKELATSTNTERVSEGSKDSGTDDGRGEGKERELKWYQKKDSEHYSDKRSASAPTPVADSTSDAQVKASNSISNPVDTAAIPSIDANVSESSAVVQVTQTSSQPDSSSPASSAKSNVEQPGQIIAAKKSLGAPENRSQSPSTTKSAKPLKTEPLDQQQQIRLIQRIARSFNRLNAEGGVVNLKLHPPQLGSLNVQVRLEGRDMAAKLTTETVAAKEAIIENLAVLRSRLSEQGFEISTFQVDVGGGQTDANSQGRAGQWAFSQGEQSGFGKRYSGNGQGRNPLPQADTATRENVPQSVVDLFTDQSIDVHA